MPDTSRPVATGRDSSYELTIDEAAGLYARAGHPRTPRSIQRYCARGDLDCVKETTSLGPKFFINAQSVARHIAQIEELIALDNRATRRDETRPDATPVAPHLSDGSARHDALHLSAPVADAAPTQPDNAPHDNVRPAATEAVVSRPVATGPAPELVAQLEREVEHLKEDKAFLREQVKTKDVQIAALLERDRETNILVGSLQRMLAPLLGHRREAPHDNPRDQHDGDMR